MLMMPIFTCEENFYVLASENIIGSKILHFELENDEIYKNYGTNWNLFFNEHYDSIF
jgi:hypothetical protein